MSIFTFGYVADISHQGRTVFSNNNTVPEFSKTAGADYFKQLLSSNLKGDTLQDVTQVSSNNVYGKSSAANGIAE